VSPVNIDIWDPSNDDCSAWVGIIFIILLFSCRPASHQNANWVSPMKHNGHHCVSMQSRAADLQVHGRCDTVSDWSSAHLCIFLTTAWLTDIHSVITELTLIMITDFSYFYLFSFFSSWCEALLSTGWGAP